MSISGIVLLVLAVAFAGGGGREVWRAWRDPRWSPSPIHGILLAPFGSMASRGAARAVAPRAIILISLAVLLAAYAVAPPPHEGWAAVVRGAGTGVGLVGVLGGGILLAMIVSHSRPRFLVPPRLRSGASSARTPEAEAPDPRYWSRPAQRR
jgi:hypothetical protein